MAAQLAAVDARQLDARGAVQQGDERLGGLPRPGQARGERGQGAHTSSAALVAGTAAAGVVAGDGDGAGVPVTETATAPV